MRDSLNGLLFPTSAVYLRIASVGEKEGLGLMRLSKSDYEIWAGRTPLRSMMVEGAWDNKLAARTLHNLSQFHPGSKSPSSAAPPSRASQVYRHLEKMLQSAHSPATAAAATLECVCVLRVGFKGLLWKA